MKKLISLILSLLIFIQYGICGNVPQGLKSLYGNTDPCEHYILDYNMDEIRKLDDREFNIYKIQNEKCENYKKAIIELQASENELQASKDEQVVQVATYNLIYYVIIGALFYWAFIDPIVNPEPICSGDICI